jgi:NitT/TauT family transport system substrate-binding protein
VEGDPLLTKDIRFLFIANDDKLDPKYDAENDKNLEAIKSLLQVSPGSSVLLRGHVDAAKIEELKREGEATFRQYSLRAVDLSKRRANEVKRLLTEKFGTDGSRIDVVGRGWEEPVSTESAKNRRVEVQWFTLE